MTVPGLAHHPGGATSHLSASARFTLAAGLLALGIGALALVNLELLPRYLAPAQATRFASLAVPPPSPAPLVVLPTSPAEQGEVGGGEGPPEVAIAVSPVASVPAPPEVPPPRPAQREEVGGEGPPAATEFPDLHFARNTTWLSATSRDTLGRVVDLLKESPTRRVVLAGHTDNLGDPDANRWLALSRARRAGRYLKARGIESAQIEIQGLGSEPPAAGEPLPEARARNRRVEIVVH
jgi:outer membrane protein OmpA-like peptidoglycan-associated protein